MGQGREYATVLARGRDWGSFWMSQCLRHKFCMTAVSVRGLAWDQFRLTGTGQHKEPSDTNVAWLEHKASKLIKANLILLNICLYLRKYRNHIMAWYAKLSDIMFKKYLNRINISWMDVSWNQMRENTICRAINEGQSMDLMSGTSLNA